MQAAGGVEDDDILAEPRRLLEGRLCDLLDLALAAVEGDVFALGKRSQLLDGSGAAQVERYHRGPVAIALGEQGQLHRSGGLAGSLNADEHDGRGRGGRVEKALGVPAEQLDELGVHRLDDLLRRGEAGRDLDADQARTNVLDELLDHLEVDVGLEQCQPHLAQRRLHVFGAKDAPPRDLLQGCGEPVSESFKQGVA